MVGNDHIYLHLEGKEGGLLSATRPPKLFKKHKINAMVKLNPYIVEPVDVVAARKTRRKTNRIKFVKTPMV